MNRRKLLVAAIFAAASASANPLSDGAGEVIAVGNNVTRFKVGDRVAGIFFEKWIDGAPSEAAPAAFALMESGGFMGKIVIRL